MWEFHGKHKGLEEAAKALEALLNFDIAVENYWNNRTETSYVLSNLLDASVELQKYMEKK